MLMAKTPKALEKLAGSLGETWRRDNGSQEALVLRPEGLRGWMEGGHSSQSKQKGGKGEEPDASLGSELGCTVHPVSTQPPWLCPWLAWLPALPKPAASARAQRAGCCSCSEVHRSLGGG